jgi:ElaB/YqjD/DUF883 family membrane-anchored ribosome-binding protein
MAQEPDVIRHQIEETRESLADKLETLEGQVKQTIGSVTSTVEQTLGTVKSKVEDTVQSVSSAVEHTVDSVRRTFDIPHQVRRHPYAMTGGALLLGTALGYLLTGRRRRPERYDPVERAPSYAPPAPAPASAYEEPRRSEERRESRPGFFAGLLQPFAAEFDKIKATAIGALLGMARDLAVRSVPPSLVPKVEEIINDVTRRAGGDVVSGSVLPSSGNAGRNG